jgi:uncharacterized protein YheU (UPF0270 family)
VIEIPYQEIDRETLLALIEAFVLREGTDYGEREASLDKKVNDIFLQVQSGDLRILFDSKEESCNIVHKNELSQYFV